MKLPRLAPDKRAHRRPWVSCAHHDYCGECPLHLDRGGVCEGCTAAHREEMNDHQKFCQQQCHSCTGYAAKLTAICCRSPLKVPYLDAVTQNPSDWGHPKVTLTQREPLSFERKAIFYANFGSAAKVTGGTGYLVDHDVVAVSMSHVKGMGTGFYSADLHDYLCLPRHTKIILLTQVIDDHLERAWDAEFYGDPEVYEKAGISYWMPLAFSASPADQRMHQFYQYARILYSASKSQCHFWPSIWPTGLHVSDQVLAVLEKIPNVIFNMQFTAGGKDEILDVITDVATWHKRVPTNVTFWFVGAATPTLIHNLKRVTPGRDVYYVVSKPLYMAVNGKRLRPDGGEIRIPRDQKIDKHELCLDNYAVFESMVKSYG